MGVPSVSASTTIDWGSWAAQAIEASESIVAAAASQAEGAALATVPFGTVLETFIGPTVVQSYVKQAMQNLAGMLQNQTLTATNPVETYVMNAMNTFEKPVAELLGDKLLPLIQAEIAKL